MRLRSSRSRSRLRVAEDVVTLEIARRALQRVHACVAPVADPVAPQPRTVATAAQHDAALGVGGDLVVLHVNASALVDQDAPLSSPVQPVAPQRRRAAVQRHHRIGAIVGDVVAAERALGALVAEHARIIAAMDAIVQQQGRLVQEMARIHLSWSLDEATESCRGGVQGRAGAA